MNIPEFFRKAQTNWGAFDGDPDEVFGIWRGALADVKPHQLQAAFDFLVKNSRFKPKPADVFSALDKIGMATERPKDAEGVKIGLMLAYAATRRFEMMDDWRFRNRELWREAEVLRWDGPWLTEARKRAHDLAQIEYLAKNHGWPNQAAIQFEVKPEEIRDHHRGELCLSFTAEQLDVLRKMGAMVNAKPERVYGWKSAGEAIEEDAA